MKTYSKNKILKSIFFWYLLFFKLNTYSQHIGNCIPSNLVFDEYISKMKLDIPIDVKNGIEKVNLTIFDFQQKVTIDTTGIKIVNPSNRDTHATTNSLTHADKTLIVIKKITDPIVRITHVNCNTKESAGNNIGYMTELRKAIYFAKSGDILFLIFNNFRFWGAKENNPEKFTLLKEAVGKNIIVIESAGNENKNENIPIIVNGVIVNRDIPSIVVGGAIIENGKYQLAKCSNFGSSVDVYGPSCIKTIGNNFFCQSSSGSAVITSMAVRLQYECKKTLHKFLSPTEMQDIFRNAPSEMEVNNVNSPHNKIPQYDKILEYAKTNYFKNE